jgi:hypothetical protein
MNRRLTVSAALVAVSIAGSLSSDAKAYTCETLVTPGCHERISADALRVVRGELATAKPLDKSGDDDALIDDLPFHVPDDLSDIGGATLLMGVRDNDLKGLSPSDLEELPQITADDGSQHEHCLRNTEEVEPAGTRQAVDDCRSYILQTLTSALDGLDDSGTPDATKRQSFQVGLAVRGVTTVSVPIFYLRAGQAIHAIEDSFAHDWRDANDPHKITVALNWIAFADSDINEPVTGPAHEQELDRCDDPDALRTERRQLATEASAEALHAALDPSLSRDQKIAAFQSVLDS